MTGTYGRGTQDRAWRQLSDEEAWEVVLEHEGLVHKVLDKYCKQADLWFEEWYSAAMMAAHKAVQTYDPLKKGTRLSTWMWACIWNGIRNTQRIESPDTRRVRQTDGRRVWTKLAFLSDPRLPDIDREEEAVDWFDLQIDPGSDFEADLVERLDLEELGRQIEEALDDLLDPVDRVVFDLHVFEGKTFPQIGEELGFTKQRAQQRWRRGRDTIREALLPALRRELVA